MISKEVRVDSVENAARLKRRHRDVTRKRGAIVRGTDSYGLFWSGEYFGSGQRAQREEEEKEGQGSGGVGRDQVVTQIADRGEGIEFELYST